MRSLWITIVGLGVCYAGPVVADDDGWPALQMALQGPQLQLEISSADAVPLKQEAYPFRLPGHRCPKIPVEAFKAYKVKVHFEQKRTYSVNILVGKLPRGFDVYSSIVAAAPDPADEDGCIMPKSGLSFLQFGQYLLAFPTFCRDVYPYRKALPIVIKALKDFWGRRSPKQFIYAPCGTMFPKLVALDEYLNDAEEPKSRRNAAQAGIAPDGRSPAAPARR
jgi:hypothetical protein